MRTSIIVAVFAAFALAGCGGDTHTPHATEPKIETDDQKALYVLGRGLAQRMSIFQLTPEELAIVQLGISDTVQNKPAKAEGAQFEQKLQELAKSRSALQADAEKKAGAAFAEKAAQEAGATKTASGAIVKEITPGTGAQPKPTDKVKVHYHGTLTDGTVFDSSVDRKQPATFPLNGVIKCWTEGVATMKVGGKSRLVCPSDVAYGDRGFPPKIKAGATLVFEVELLEILAEQPKDQPKTP